MCKKIMFPVMLPRYLCSVPSVGLLLSALINRICCFSGRVSMVLKTKHLQFWYSVSSILKAVATDNTKSSSFSEVFSPSEINSSNFKSTNVFCFCSSSWLICSHIAITFMASNITSFLFFFAEISAVLSAYNFKKSSKRLKYF